MNDWHSKQIGKYQVKKLLGHGAMGAVYKAFHPTLERDVAIKLIHPHLTGDPGFLDRFRREAKIVATLRHPGIVQVHDFDVEGDTCYMVMEFVEGESLEQRLVALHAQGERMPLTETLRLFQLITQAVAYAHSQDVVHRDLKPANVLLTPQGQPILVDFGLSKIVGGEQLTASGAVLGTPAYMSPEQCSGEVGDARSDVYALGVMLYQLTTGVPPFSDDTPVGVILKHLSEPPAPPRSINPELPADVEQVIQQALAKDPADRFPSAQEMLAALEELVAPLEGFPVTMLDVEADARCPYRGLQAFEEEHAEFFFGREALVGQLVEKLTALIEQGEAQAGRFLAVLGASGSGKSSLVRAGLIPALRAGAVPDSAGWIIVVMAPGERPLEELAVRLAPILVSEGDRLATAHQLLDNLASDGRALHLAVRLAWTEVPPERCLLLVIDQFEEVFTLCHDEEARRRFIENLLYAAAVGDGRAVVLLAMRADFYHHCAAYRDLAGRLSAQQILVGPMNEAELRRAIERPAQAVGLRFEPGLVDTILADVAQQPGALPLLQHALLELWERRHGRLLTLRAYQASGGVGGAIAQRAETLYAGFSPEEQAIVRRVMLRLTQPGEGTEDTRRRVRKSELLPGPGGAGIEPDEGQTRAVEAVIQRLADARLVTTTRNMVTGEEQVDVAHEALIRGWARLRGWLDEDRAALRTHRRLTEAANEWERGQRDESYLYRGARLAEAEEWAEAHAADMNPLEREFLGASVALRDREAQEAERRRQRELAQARRLAEEQRQRAEEQTRTAAQLRRRALWLGGALTMLGGVLILALIAAVAAVWFGRQAASNATIAQTEAARAIAAEGTAQAEAARAIAAEATAVAEAKRAISAESTAVAEAERAEAQQLEAERQRRIALSRQLAAQALTHVDDQLDLALLLSLEANRITDTAEVRGSLLAGLESTSPHLVAFLHGHTDKISSVAFSPDGQILVSGGEDDTLILWDVAACQSTGQPLIGDDGWVAFSPDGKTLASGGLDNTILLWDVATYQLLGQPLTRRMRWVQSAALSPDGKTLALGGCGEQAGGTCDQGEIRLWDVATRQPIGQPLTGHTGLVNSVAFSPDDNILASGGEDDTIILWDVTIGQPIGQPLAGHTRNVNSVAFSPDGKTLASSSSDDTIILWDVAAAQPIGQPLAGHTSDVLSVAFSPDGQMLASGGRDETVILWDVATGQPIGQPLIGHADDVNSVAFSPDTLTGTGGKMLASGGCDNNIILWDLAGRQSLGQTLASHTGVWSMALSPDGKTLASGGMDGTVTLWDMTAHQPIGQPLTGHTDWVASVAFSSDSKTLASGSCGKSEDGICKQGEVRLWDVATRQPLGEPLTGHTHWAWSVAFSPDGKTLASGSGDHTIILWDVTTGQPIGQRLTNHVGVYSVAFSPDGEMLASGGTGGTVTLWDIATRQPLGEPLTGHTEDVWSLAFSPDSKMLASGSDDDTIVLWDVATGQPIGPPLTGHAGDVSSVAFSPDDQTLASASDDSTIILWDVTTGQPIGPPLTGHTVAVYSVVFSPDGKTLISGSGDRTIRLWDVSFESWQARACRIANRNLTREEWEQYLGDEPYRVTCPDALLPEE